MTKLRDLKTRLMKNEEFAQAYQQADTDYGFLEDLIRLRMQARLTQDELAKRMKTSQAAIARMEAGNVSPSINMIRRYAAAVGSTVKIGFTPLQPATSTDVMTAHHMQG